MRLAIPAPRRIVALGAAGALVPLVGGCGGSLGSEAPTDASVQDFCAAYERLYEVKDGADVRQWAEDLAAVGTPSDIGDSAREGFELTVDEAAEGPNLNPSEENERLNGAFTDYVFDTCAGRTTE